MPTRVVESSPTEPESGSRTNGRRTSSTSDDRVQEDDAPPVSLTPMIGRQRERTVVADLLRNPEVRLLVLTGPGGVGKTRLAASIAESVRPSFRDGVSFVDLAPIISGNLVLPTIAMALRVRNTGAIPLIESVNSFLRSRNILLLVDNFEHVTEAAGVLTELLVANPGLTILVTSRSVLSVYGEHVYPVPPMAVPLVPDRNRQRKGRAQAISATDAVKLFVKRATAVRSDFRLTDDNASYVAEICRAADGLPLAIELAAARISLLSPRMLATRLHRTLPLLADGPSNVPDRLRTMRNAVDWSYGLLTPREQAVFRRVAVISGGWTIDDAQALSTLPEDEHARDEMETFDHISSLVDKSLVRQMDTAMGLSQFAMLQTLREYGLEQLTATGEREPIEALHASHLLNIAERAQPELTGPTQAEWLDRLGNLQPDFLQAFTWMTAHEPPEASLRLATALWRYRYTRGHIREGREWLEEALTRNPARTHLRATALNGAGVLANMEGRLDITRELHREALSIAEELNDLNLIATARLGLGDVEATARNSTEALSHWDICERIFRQLDDRRMIGATFTNRGNLLWTLKLTEEALATHERAKTEFHLSSDQRGVAWAVTNIGRIAAQQGDYARALPNLAEALTLYVELGDRGGYAETLEGLAQIAIDADDVPRALSLLAAADGIREAVEHPVAPIDREAYNLMLDKVQRVTGTRFSEEWEHARAVTFEEIQDQVAAFFADAPAPSVVTGTRQRGVSSLIRDLGISERELEVLSLIAAGKTDKDIGEELFISIRTVQSHVAHLLTKLEVSARSAAVARALRTGMIS